MRLDSMELAQFILQNRAKLGTACFICETKGCRHFIRRELALEEVVQVTPRYIPVTREALILIDGETVPGCSPVLSCLPSPLFLESAIKETNENNTQQDEQPHPQSLAEGRRCATVHSWHVFTVPSSA